MKNHFCLENLGLFLVTEHPDPSSHELLNATGAILCLNCWNQIRVSYSHHLTVLLLFTQQSSLSPVPTRLPHELLPKKTRETGAGSNHDPDYKLKINITMKNHFCLENLGLFLVTEHPDPSSHELLNATGAILCLNCWNQIRVSYSHHLTVLLLFTQQSSLSPVPTRLPHELLPKKARETGAGSNHDPDYKLNTVNNNNFFPSRKT